MRISPFVPKVSIPKSVTFPVIDPVPDGVHRPFWSVMIPTYNRAGYLERTLKSVLAQDPGPDEMQIEVIDNCSTQGDSEAVVKKLAGERVGFFRQEQTVSPNVQGTTCIARARGHWVHVLHDDDMVMLDFYATYRRFIEEHPEVVLVCSRALAIDENDDLTHVMHTVRDMSSTGVWETALRDMVYGNWIVAPTVVAARRAYEQVGSFTTGLTYLGDWEMWVRLATVGAVGYIHQPHLLYRFHHSKSETSQMVMNGERFKEVPLTIEINVSRLPAAEQRQAREAALRHDSGTVTNYRWMLHAKQQHAAALRHALWAFRLDPRKQTFIGVLISTLIAGKRKIMLYK